MTARYVREPGGPWHVELPTYRWEAPKAACDMRVLHPCEVGKLTAEQAATELMCQVCARVTSPSSGGDA